MSSSRRRGRPPGAPANSQPPTLTAPQSEVADALLAETSADKGQENESRPSEQESETAVTEVPAVEAAAEPPAGDASAETGASSTEPATVSATGSAPVEAQADENDQPIEPPAQDAVEAAAVPDDAPVAPSAPESLVSGAAEAAAETAQTAVETTNETLAQTLAETALLPGLAETKATKGAAPQSHSVHIGASFAFVPSFAPITEINAKLFAFARGEGEAALAHIQALARAKSPAEALRLQVTEMQRAADASLTCFSEIVRSANRLSDSARRH